MEDHVDPVNNEYFTGLHQEIINIEDTLGLSPEGLFDTVKDRLDNIVLQGFNYYETNYAYIVSDRNAFNSELGTNPSGTFDTVKARLDDIDTKILNSQDNQYSFIPTDFVLPASNPCTLTKVDGANFSHYVLDFPDGGLTYAYLNFVLPTVSILATGGFNIFHYCEGTGSVHMRWSLFLVKEGENIVTQPAATVTLSFIKNFQAGDINKIFVAHIVFETAPAEGKYNATLKLWRDTGSANDDNVNPVRVLGVVFHKA